MSFTLARVVARAAPSMVARRSLRPCAAVPVSIHRPVSVGCTRWFTSSGVRATKYTTRIAGLDVVPNGREVLIGLQKEILASIEQYNKALGVSVKRAQDLELLHRARCGMLIQSASCLLLPQFEPACNEYSRRFAAHRLQVAEEEDDVTAIESRLWSGQIEELIEQAENELDAVVLMNEEVKPWEKPDAEILKQYQQLASPNFGQDPAQFATGKPAELTKEEAQAVEEFWKPIDEEIRQDQAREAEERAQRRGQKRL
jgi:hypothetical protein